jgi:carbamoyl-phosphate synthase large subunit
MGALISVEDYDYTDAIALAEKFTDLGIRLYATPDTAARHPRARAGGHTARTSGENSDIYDLVNSRTDGCIVYTGPSWTAPWATSASCTSARCAPHPCMTSLDTASAFADIIAARYDQRNTRSSTSTRDTGERDLSRARSTQSRK